MRLSQLSRVNLPIPAHFKHLLEDFDGCDLINYRTVLSPVKTGLM